MGSNPTGTTVLASEGPVAQWIARLTSNQAVVGSSPTGVVFLYRCGGLAQSVECVVCNDEAPGSKPGFSIRSYSVMVITLDFESSDPGSNPGRTSFCVFFFFGSKTNSKRRGPRGIRTPDLSHPKRESYPYVDHWPLLTEMKLEGFEPPTFGSGIRRLAIRP